MEIRAGEIVGLIGPNGAGKTSFIDGITGFTPYTGSVELDGHRARRRQPARPGAPGLVRTWQSVELFHDLSVRHNVQVVDRRRQRRRKLLRDAVRPNRPPTPPVVDNDGPRCGLDDVADRKPSELSLGRQKLVGVARALAQQPHVLLLDEPAAGLDTDRERRVRSPASRRSPPPASPAARRPRHAPDDGGLRPHLRHRVRPPIADGTPEQVRADPAVIAAYLGAGHGGTQTAAARMATRRDLGGRAMTRPLIETRRPRSPATASSAVVRGLDLTVGAGEVVCLLGANGAGKSTTLLTIAGALPALGGTVNVLGAPVTGGEAHEVAQPRAGHRARGPRACSTG